MKRSWEQYKCEGKVTKQSNMADEFVQRTHKSPGENDQ